jgi:hypothetical protein
MRILVCGGRDYDNQKLVDVILDTHLERWGGIHIIEGGATGADTLARNWAIKNKVPYTTFPADWRKLGKAAGPIRNQQMLDEGKPDMYIAFPGGSGTADMIKKAQNYGISGHIMKG